MQFVRFCAIVAAIAILSAGLATGCAGNPAPAAPAAVTRS
jgi:hypothetical protein